MVVCAKGRYAAASYQGLLSVQGVLGEDDLLRNFASNRLNSFPELSDHQNTQNLMADSIFGVPGARNPKKSSKINFARFLSSPSTPGPNLAPMDLCGIFGFSSPSTVGPYNNMFPRSST